MANENNNLVTHSRDELSEMDKLFVPQDLDGNLDLGDFVSYKSGVKFWRSVPSNCRLVLENRFTGEISFKSGAGLKFVPPIFYRTILVPGPELEGVKTFNGVKCLSRDKIELSVDLTLSMSIVDPAKYVRQGKHQLSQLSSIVNRLLRVYVANKRFDDLVTDECDIDLFDKNGELDDFADQNGIQINKVIFEKIELPERLKKLYNDAAEEEQRKKAQSVRLKAELEKARSDAQITDIHAEAESKKISKLGEAKTKSLIYKLNNLRDTLIEKGVSNEEIDEMIKTIFMSENGNASFFIGGNDTAKSVGAGVAAGRNYSPRLNQNPESDRKVSNSERLLNDLKLRMSLNRFSKESYDEVESLLRNSETKGRIDSLDRDGYNSLLNQLIEEERGYTSSSRTGNVK